MKFDSADRMKFGIFIAPYHAVGTNPTLAFERDLQLVEHLDSLGYDEAWFGEHHSSGVELISSPELMIAAAAQRTSRIKLGTGVASLPYHHPLTLADRIVQLDHMTRGRAMFGVGPGQLLADARMLGIDPSKQRERMEESLAAILRLFKGETVDERTDWYELNNARLHLLPYSDFDVAVTGGVSPTGPKLAGQLGTGLLSVAATSTAGVEVLANHWKIVEEEAAAAGNEVSRRTWRLMGPMHIAESMDQAIEDVSYGLEWITAWLDRVTPTAAAAPSTDVKSIVEAMNASGRAVIGTPDMAIQQLERLQAKSGGFGTYLFLGGDFASFDATKRSYSLFADEVIPRFGAQAPSFHARRRSYQSVIDSGRETAEATAKSQQEAVKRYQESKKGSAQ